MSKYNSPNWVCPSCGAAVTLTEKDEAPEYCYKCPSCGEITGADEWRERLHAEWIAYRNDYRLYSPSFPQDTVAYVDDLSEVDESKYDVLVTVDNSKPTVIFDSKGASGNIYAILGMVQAVMRKLRRYTDFNTLRDRVFEAKSYEDALTIIREYVRLIDIAEADADSGHGERF